MSSPAAALAAFIDERLAYRAAFDTVADTPWCGIGDGLTMICAAGSVEADDIETVRVVVDGFFELGHSGCFAGDSFALAKLLSPRMRIRGLCGAARDNYAVAATGYTTQTLRCDVMRCVPHARLLNVVAERLPRPHLADYLEAPADRMFKARTLDSLEALEALRVTCAISDSLRDGRVAESVFHTLLGDLRGRYSTRTLTRAAQAAADIAGT